MVSTDTSDTWDFAFIAGLLSGCRDNQNIMDNSFGLCSSIGDIRPCNDDYDNEEIQPLSLN